MKPFSKYVRFISLLFFSGLILSLHTIPSLYHPAEKHISQKSKNHYHYTKARPETFSIFNEVMVALFPALKS